MCKLGKPKTARNVRSVIEGTIREHSRKPDEAFEAAERLCGDLNRIELFSRQKRARLGRDGRSDREVQRMSGTINISRAIWDDTTFRDSEMSQREAWIWLVAEA